MRQRPVKGELGIRKAAERASEPDLEGYSIQQQGWRADE